MFKQIRLLLSEEGLQLGGSMVEMDEMYHGEKRRRIGGQGRPSSGSHKVPVIGMAERSPTRRGCIIARVAPNAQKETLHRMAKEFILPSSIVFTDDYVSYDGLDKLGYTHRRIRHSQKIYVAGDVHTQSIEGFGRLVKARERRSLPQLAELVERILLPLQSARERKPDFQSYFGAGFAGVLIALLTSE
jgi:transposase-like protein